MNCTKGGYISDHWRPYIFFLKKWYNSSHTYTISNWTLLCYNSSVRMSDQGNVGKSNCVMGSIEPYAENIAHAVSISKGCSPRMPNQTWVLIRVPTMQARASLVAKGWWLKASIMMGLIDGNGGLLWARLQSCQTCILNGSVVMCTS